VAKARRTIFQVGVWRLSRNDIPELIAEGGFRIKELEHSYLAPFPKSGSYCFWGRAARNT